MPRHFLSHVTHLVARLGVGTALALCPLGCGEKPAPAGGKPPGPPAAPAAAQAAAAPLTQEQKDEYDAHYAQGVVLLVDNKHEEALAAFEKAKAIWDTEEVRLQIEKIRRTIADNRQAAQLAEEIEAARKAGNLEDAGKRAAEGVEKYWETPSGPHIAELKQSIDADLARQAKDRKALAEQNYQKAQECYQRGDLRNAYLLLGEAVKQSDDAKIAGLYEDAKGRVVLYDESLRAAEVHMKTPESYEDAIAALEQAQGAWDTQEVRDRLDAARRALKARLPRIAVVDFDVKGDLGLPDAGRAVAELLLPRFQGKFELVERMQLARLVEERNLQMTDLVDPVAGPGNLVKIKRVQSLVLGSLLGFGGLHVTARIVQVNTGLTERAGRVTPPNLDQIDAYLEDLAAQLTMSEEEYRVFSAGWTPPPIPAQASAEAVPPAPTHVVEVTRGDLDVATEGIRLPEEPASTWREEEFKRDLFERIMAAVRVLMEKERYAEAVRQAEMALVLYPDNAQTMGVLSTAWRKTSFVYLPVVRDRVVVLDFAGIGRRDGVSVGFRAASLLAWNISRDFDLVERGEVLWAMDRAQLTLSRVLRSRQRLAWLGRVMGARYLVIGYTAPGEAGEEIGARVLDTQTGVVRSVVQMRVHDAEEMRVRIAGFSRALFVGPDERRAWLAAGERASTLYADAHSAMRDKRYGVALRSFADLLSVLRADLDPVFSRTVRASYEEAGLDLRQAQPRKPAVIVASDLAAVAQESRKRLEQARELAEALRGQLEDAYQEAMASGNAAMAAGNSGGAMRSFAGAMGLKRTAEAEEGYRAAKQRADKQRALWSADQKSRREYSAHMQAGRKSILLARFADAIKSFEAAIRVKATEEAQAALANAQKGAEEFERQKETARAAAERRQAERLDRMYEACIAAGRTQLDAKNYVGALRDFVRAVSVKDTADAKAGVKAAQEGLAEQEGQPEQAAAAAPVGAHAPGETKTPTPPAPQPVKGEVTAVGVGQPVSQLRSGEKPRGQTAAPSGPDAGQAQTEKPRPGADQGLTLLGVRADGVKEPTKTAPTAQAPSPPAKPFPAGRRSVAVGPIRLGGEQYWCHSPWFIDVTADGKVTLSLVSKVANVDRKLEGSGTVLPNPDPKQRGGVWKWDVDFKYEEWWKSGDGKSFSVEGKFLGSGVTGVITVYDKSRKPVQKSEFPRVIVQW